jgi:tetratricopeptide (TPR) repeat protein
MWAGISRGKSPNFVEEKMKKVFGLLCFFCALAGYAQTRTEQEAARYYNSGREHYGTGEYDRAIADLTQAIRLNPRDANYYLWRGAAYYARAYFNAESGPRRRDRAFITASYKDDMEKAVADFESVIRLDPNGGNTRTARGYIELERSADADGPPAPDPFIPTVTPPPDFDWGWDEPPPPDAPDP